MKTAMKEPLLQFYDNSGFEQQIKALSKSLNHRILKKISFPKITQVDINKVIKYKGYTTHRAVYLDVETTGLDSAIDEVIQICILPFIYGVSADQSHSLIFGVYEPYVGLQEPSVPLSQEIVELTGITMEMLEGQSLDVDKIEHYIGKSELIVAHNAAFDRPFTHKVSDKFKEKNWACSLKDIDWQTQGFESKKLGHLAAELGYFFEAHKADNDCYAGLTILLQLAKNESSFFHQLLQNSYKTSITLRAQYAPFDKKDILKSRGYFWKDGSDGVNKGWEITLNEATSQDEKNWLKEHIYNGAEKYLEWSKTALTRYY